MEVAMVTCIRYDVIRLHTLTFKLRRLVTVDEVNDHRVLYCLIQ